MEVGDRRLQPADHARLVDLAGEVHLQSPLGDAADLCSSAGGAPTGSPIRIAGIPGSVAGTCVFRPSSLVKGAAVAAFIRGNVAVLIEISSRSKADVDPRSSPCRPPTSSTTALPSGGVPISSGGVDVEWILFWLCILAALAFGIVACARRRGSWRGPFVAVAEAFGRRKVALGVSVVAVVGAMAFSMLDSTVMRGFGEWYGLATFGDFWQNWADAAHMTFAGGYGHIYVLDRTLETAPASAGDHRTDRQIGLRPFVSLPECSPVPDGVLGGGAAVPGWNGTPHLCVRPMAQRHGGNRYPSSPHRSRRDGDHASTDPLERSS